MSSSASGPIFNSIESKLNSAFNPIHLDIINESYMHNVPKGSETHFKVVIVSENFKEMKSLIQKHRAVNEVLAEELSNGICVHCQLWPRPLISGIQNVKLILVQCAVVVLANKVSSRY